MASDVSETLRRRFTEIAAERGIDTSAVTLETSGRGYLRIDGPGIRPTEVWGNSGVRDVVDAIASGSDPADEGAARNAAEGRSADRREDVETVQSIEAVGAGGGSPDPDAYAALAGIEEGSDRLFISRVADGRLSLSAYETAAREDRIGSVVIDPESSPNAATRLLNSLRDLGPDAAREAAAGVETDAELAEAAAERETRRETREAAREAAAAAGVDLDEFDIGATAGGAVILQDEDTGRTRRIDADADGGLASALEAETSGGEFVADAADPAAGTAPGDGLGARAVAAIVLLLGAIAAAVGWSS